MKKGLFEFEYKIASSNPLGGISTASITRNYFVKHNKKAFSNSVDYSLSTLLILKRQEPALELVDEIIFLLHTAAEIEHSLMVQYLYGAYSLPNSSPHSDWRSKMLEIAREEMGHLIAVQNMLISLGGPLNLEREDYPFNIFYPFPFKLEPFSIQSVAKYVLAEMPNENNIPQSLNFNLEEVKADAGVGDNEIRIERVGALFERILELASMLDQSHIQKASEAYQANPDDWRAGRLDYRLILYKVKTINGSNDGIVPLIKAIGEQGEGPSESPISGPSHFLRFYELYNSIKEYKKTNKESPLSNAVPENPTVHYEKSGDYAKNPHFLTHPKAYIWGDVFNQRFRWLLVCIQHYLMVNEELPERTMLCNWAFQEMRNLGEIADLLSRLPQHQPIQRDSFNRICLAGAPFELPYSLNLPNRSNDLWHYHKRLASHSLNKLSDINETTAISIRKIDQERLETLKSFII